MKNLYAVTIGKEIYTICDSWRKGYLAMLENFKNTDNHWTVMDVIHENVDDRFVWMDTSTGECIDCIIDEVELNSGVPRNRYENIPF